MSTEPVSVWVVEDNRMLRRNLAELIDDQKEMACSPAVESCEEFLTALDQDRVPDVVLMDLGLPGKSGIGGIVRIQSISPSTKVIVLTIHEENEKIFEAICAGTSGYLLKPSPQSASWRRSTRFGTGRRRSTPSSPARCLRCSRG